MTSSDVFGAHYLAALDFSAVTPQQFARIVRAVPGRVAAEFMAGPHRRRVLDELFHRMESLVRPGAAAGRAVMIRWRVTAPDGAVDTYETDIADGTCTVTAHATERPARLTLTMAAPELLRLASGAVSGPALFLTRRLRAHGDFRLAGSLMYFFDIPKI